MTEIKIAISCARLFLETETLPSPQACSELFRLLIPTSSGGVKASSLWYLHSRLTARLTKARDRVGEYREQPLPDSTS